jgi:hypothetical protein
MITNRKIIYDFKQMLDKERLSDQVGYPNRFIFNHILNYRATLLKRKKLQNKLSDLNYQTYTINLVEVKDEELPCVDSSFCVLLKTEKPVEDFIDLKSITSPINKSGEVIKISEVDPDMIKFKSQSKLPAQNNNIYYYLQNTGKGVYVYIWSSNPLFLQSVSIKGIFYNPHIVEAIKDCAGNLDPCYNYLEANFPIDPELLTDIYSMAFSVLLKAKTIVTDTFNDNLDTIVSNPTPLK